MLDGKCFLLEAKWHKATLPASAIYQFKAKVDGKLIGTIGIFLSISGYSKDTVEALRFGKSLNVILFDKDDFEICLSQKITFSEILRTKLRRATETSEVYFPYKTELTFQQFLGDILFVVEGFSEQAILSQLASKVLNNRGIQKRIEFAIALGKNGVANLAISTLLSPTANTNVVFVVDSDGDEEKTKRLLAKHLERLPDNILVAQPSIAAWVFPTQEAYWKYLSVNIESARQILIKQLSDVDVDKIEKTNKSFQELVRLLTE